MLVVSSSWLYQGREWDRGAEEAGEGGVELPGERFEGPVWTKQFTYITWISSHNGGSVRLSDQVESDAVRGLNCWLSDSKAYVSL